MRDVFKEYRQGLISWEEAYRIANNNAASSSNSDDDELEHWCKQMESLGVDASEYIMTCFLGYKQNKNGILYK